MSNIIELNISNSLSVIHLEVLSPRLREGEELEFTFTLQNTADTPLRADIRYEIGCPAENGGMEYRLYKMSNRICPSGFLLFNRTHTMLSESGLTLRPGVCELRIVVNGRRLETAFFTMLP